MKQKIKDICEKGSSNLKQKELLSEGKYPVFGAGGLSGYLNTYHQEREYIGIVKDGSGIGRVDFYPAKTSLIGTMQYIIPLHGFNIRYIGYCLQSLDLSKHKQGAAIPHIYFRDYGEQEVNITPDIAEQEEIVSRLDKAFEKIDTLRHNAEQSLTTTQQLFQSSLTNLLTPQPHWQRKTLGTVCEVLNGLWKGKKGPLVNVGVIRNANFTKDFTLRYDNVEWLDVEVRQFEKRKLHKGDLIVEKSGGSEKQPVGRAVLYDLEDGDYSFSNFTSVLRIKDSQLTSCFLYYYLLDTYLCGDTKAMQKATTGIHNIEMEKYLSIAIPIIPLPEQATIVAKLDLLSAKVKQLKDNYTRTIALCDEMKQALLKEVFE